ncbi:MAG: F0F1 ATP synthase subunit B [Candidatus Eiseniibacteriota bacterium]
MTEFLENPETWVAAAFLIFVAFVAWKAFGPAMKSLDARAARIKAELDEAQRLRDEAQHLLAEYKRKQRDAVKEAEEQMRAAQEEAQRQRERAEVDLANSLKRREQQALDRIGQAESEALAEVRTLAVDLAVGATRKLIAETVDQGKAAALVDDAIKNLPQKLH